MASNGKKTGVKLQWATVKEIRIDGPFERILRAAARPVVNETRKAIRRGKNLSGQEANWRIQSFAPYIRFVVTSSKRRRREQDKYKGRIVFHGAHDGDPKRKPQRAMIANANANRARVSLMLWSASLVQKARDSGQLMVNKLISEKAFKTKIISIRKVIGYKK